MKMYAIVLSLILTTTSGCRGPQTYAVIDCPPRPDLVGLTDDELAATPEPVKRKMYQNIVEIQKYVLKCESSVQIASGGN